MDSESSRTHVINNGAFVQIVGHKQEQASVLAQPCYHGGTMTMKFKAAILWLATGGLVANVPLKLQYVLTPNQWRGR